MQYMPSSHPPMDGSRCGRPRRAAHVCYFAVTLAGGITTGLSAQATPDSTAVVRLRDAIVAASPLIAARRAELAAAEARVRAAGAAPAAILDAELEEVPDGFDVTNAGSMRVELSRELPTGGRGGARRGLATADVLEASARAHLTERRVGSQVDRLLTRSLGSMAIGQRLAAEDSLLRDAEEALRVRFAVADAAYVDVLRLRTERLRVQTDLAMAITDSRVSRRALLALAGSDEAAMAIRRLADSVLAQPATLVLEGELPPAPSLDSLVALSGASRLADASLARTEAGAQLRRAELRPALSAALGLQRFSGGDAGAFQVGPTLGFTMSLPFTRSGANRAEREAADLTVAAARRQHEAALVTVRADLTAARDRYETARQRLAVFDAALLRGAREERESALSAFRTGELSLLELLDFERALARTEIVRLRSRIEAVDAYSDLIAGAAGEPAEAHAPATLLDGGAE